MGDCGIKSGGAVIEVPMLVHPPFTAATFVGVARGTGALDVVGLFVQLGGAEVAPELVGHDGAALLGEPEVVSGKSCWFAARMPASTPSRSAVPVPVNAFCARSGIVAAPELIGCPYRS